MPVANALIGLGSNLGDRLATLDAALEQLQTSADVEIYRQSPWLETEPAGGPPKQTPYLNGAAWLKTQLPPEVLLARLHEIERSLGRERQEIWGPRTLDLDLLLYDDLILNLPELQIPHRWLPFRSFVLDPAVVIAPDWVHPILQKSIYDLRVQLRAIPYWFVIGGGSLAVREALAGQLAERFQGYRIAHLNQGDQLAGKLPMRELPPRGIFISSVDWTIQDSECEAGLQLQIPARDSMPASWPCKRIGTSRMRNAPKGQRYWSRKLSNRTSISGKGSRPLPSSPAKAKTNAMGLGVGGTRMATSRWKERSSSINPRVTSLGGIPMARNNSKGNTSTASKTASLFGGIQTA